MPSAEPGTAAAVADLDDRVAAALRHALAPNTWRAYAADWRHWSAWARCYDTPAMPAEPVALARYLVDQATTTRVTTLTRRLSAIAKAHLLAGHDDPTGAPAVRGVLRGLRRERGTTSAARRRCGPPTSNASSPPRTPSRTAPGASAPGPPRCATGRCC